jgi:hypothetical protein
MSEETKEEITPEEVAEEDVNTGEEGEADAPASQE